MEKYVTIGNDIATRKPVTISDTARRSGLYILGRPGMGKTTMLFNPDKGFFRLWFRDDSGVEG
jgi:hypothetical protein